MTDGLVLHQVTCRLARRTVLSGLDARFAPGELIGVVGPNGAGKSTLLKAIAGTIPTEGRLDWQGIALSSLSRSARARTLAYMPQGHQFHWPMPVRDIVALGRIPHGLTGEPAGAHQDAIAAAVAAADLATLLDRPVTTLSGGEKARVALARALAVEAPILLADEPVSALDPSHQLRVMHLFLDSARRGALIVCVLHDLPLALRFAHRIAVIDAGRLVALDTPAALLAAGTLDRVFGVVTRSAEFDGVRIALPWSLADPGP